MPCFLKMEACMEKFLAYRQENPLLLNFYAAKIIYLYSLPLLPLASLPYPDVIGWLYKILGIDQAILPKILARESLLYTNQASGRRCRLLVVTCTFLLVFLLVLKRVVLVLLQFPCLIHVYTSLFPVQPPVRKHLP